METHLAPDTHAHFSMRTYIYMNRQNGTTIMRGAVLSVAIQRFRCRLSVDYLSILVLIRFHVLRILVHGSKAHAH